MPGTCPVRVLRLLLWVRLPPSSDKHDLLCGVGAAPRTLQRRQRGASAASPGLWVFSRTCLFLTQLRTPKVRRSWRTCSSTCHGLAARPASRKETGRSRGRNISPLCVLYRWGAGAPVTRVETELPLDLGVWPPRGWLAGGLDCWETCWPEELRGGRWLHLPPATACPSRGACRGLSQAPSPVLRRVWTV